MAKVTTIGRDLGFAMLGPSYDHLINLRAAACHFAEHRRHCVTAAQLGPYRCAVGPPA
jgi:hypothetical protein